MDRIIGQSPNVIVVKQVDEPMPLSHEVKVSTLVAGICGSDLHSTAGLHPFVPLPYIPGHEVVGVITELGSEVKDFSEGDRVTVEPTLPCWKCKMCTTGRQNLCENLTFFGCGYSQGGMADYFTIPANRLHKVPTEFSDERASLIEPLSTPVHAVRMAGGGSLDLSGKAVVIIGCGTIGLLTLLVARHAKAKKIVMTDLLQSKRTRAQRLGADVVLDAGSKDLIAEVRTTLGESADIVFDCVALQPTVDQAVALADKAGTVMIVGVPEKDVRIPLPVIQDHQIRIQGSATYLPVDYQDSIKILQTTLIDADEIVTSIYPKHQVMEGFAAARSGDQVKVLLRFH